MRCQEPPLVMRRKWQAESASAGKVLDRRAASPTRPSPALTCVVCCRTDTWATGFVYSQTQSVGDAPNRFIVARVGATGASTVELVEWSLDSDLFGNAVRLQFPGRVSRVPCTRRCQACVHTPSRAVCQAPSHLVQCGCLRTRCVIVARATSCACVSSR